MLRKCFVVLFLTFSAAMSGGTARAEPTWLEIRSPHFRVLTNGSSGDGRKVANEFEQMRYVFATRFHQEVVESGAPLTIIAMQDGATMREVDPEFYKSSKGNVAGYFEEGWEKQFAVIRLDSLGDANEVVVYHEYAHSVLHRMFHWLPRWLDEGLAEFYGYTSFEPKKIYIGAPSYRRGVLKSRPLFGTEKMLALTESSNELGDQDLNDLFYAEAWAMVHFMTFGPGMEKGAKLNTFLHKLTDAEPQVQAFREVFGEPKVFDEKFTAYVRYTEIRAAVMNPDKELDPKSFDERKLTQAETVYELGCFRIHGGAAAAGRAAMENAVVLDAKLAGPHEELAFLGFQQGKDEEARKEWSEALRLDPNRWRSLFALTMVDAGPKYLTLSEDQQRTMLAAMRRVNTLAPQFAPAYVEEALLEWQLGFLQKAYADAQHAERLEPWRAGYHVLTGRILLQGQKPAIAANYARFVAQHWKGPDHNEAVELWHQVPAAQQGLEPAPTWDVPAGMTVAWGTLQKVTCGKTPDVRAVFMVLPDGAKDGRALELTADARIELGFSDTFWWGEDHFSACHHLSGHTAMIAYDPQKNVVVDVEVRDDMPIVAKPATAPQPVSAAAKP